MSVSNWDASWWKLLIFIFKFQIAMKVIKFIKKLSELLELFNNYFTLKLSFFEASHFITNDQKTPLTLHHARHRYPLYHLFLFFEVEKTPSKIRTNHNTFTHVFKQLNEIVRFKKRNKSRVRISIFNGQPLREVLWAIASRFQG